MLKPWILIAAIAGGIAAETAAQSYPSRPVTVVVPFAAGGGTDVVARAVSADLSARWGQPVIIENRTGAGGLIGTETAAKAPADGHTLLISSSHTFTGNRYFFKSLPYDPDRSFAPITLLVQADQFLLANSAVPVTDLKELVARARQRVGALNYGSWGSGSEPHLIYEYLNSREGLEIVHIPYKGVAPVLTALTAAEIQLTVGSAGVAGRLIQAGRLKPLAIAAAKRSTRFPDVSTTAEQGFPYLRAAIMIGLWVPAGTPAAVQDKLGSDVRSVLKTPALAEKHLARGYDVIASSPEELTQLLREESARVGDIVRTANIKPE